MARQPLVARRAEELLGSSVVATSPVAGGDIATATRLRLSSGQTALMKTLPHAPAGFFEAEASGLRWLAEVDGGLPVPEVLGAASDCLVLAWVEQSSKTPPEAAAAFDGFIGTLPLPNKTAGSWPEFYAVRRVLPYLKLARDRGAITDADAAAVEKVVGRFTELIPDEPPARLHGDLWNGNCLWGQDLAIHVIDPAAYGGHREVDLAMLHLFGLTHLPRAMAAYDEAHPLVEGWEDRLGIHQLFPLLVHACMFGGTYGARAGTVAARYA
jgi:fructosamine-3-kinase